MRKALVALLAVLAALTVVPAAVSTAGAADGAAGGTSQVYVTHGLPLDKVGSKVDVFVNGALTINDFTFGTTVGPLTLPAATYDVKIETPDDSATLIEKNIAVPAGGNFSLVAAFVDAAGTPGIQVFSNDVSRTPFLTGRLALHHAAAAPAVDVDFGLYPLTRQLPFLKFQAVSGAVNGAQADFVLPTFLAYTADVRVAGTDTVVLKNDNVKVKRGVLTNVYVVGSAAAGTLQAISSTIAH